VLFTASTSSNISSSASSVNATDSDNDDGTDDNIAWKKSDDGSWGDGFPYEWLAWDDDRVESRHESFWSLLEILFGVNFLDDFGKCRYFLLFPDEFCVEIGCGVCNFHETYLTASNFSNC
jgi:hypothetical protein